VDANETPLAYVPSKWSRTTGAIASVGLPVYITSATGALVVAPGADIQLFGHALATKGAGAGVIPVRLAQFAVAVDTPA
jgi:hypothetical protein